MRGPADQRLFSRRAMNLGLGAALASLALGCNRGKPGLSITPTEPLPRTLNLVDPATLALQYPDHNLVLVSFDALQASHVGAWGNPRPVTPTLDSLAAEGFRFANAISVASWTVPASMTWFTGVYPTEHRMTNKFSVYSPEKKQLATLGDLAPQLVTLADVLKQNGYATGGFTGNAGVSGGFGYQQGFDTYYFDKGKFGRFDESVPRAVQWIREHQREKFFVFLHGYDVHGQCLPTGGLDYRFVDRNYDRKYLGSPREQELLREEGLDQGAIQLRPEDVQFWRAVYDEKVQRADAKFREFMRVFEELSLLPKTLFVITSDHGTELYEHRRFDHGFTLYNELLHVPLLVVLPERIPGKVISERVSSIDLMPTILDLLGVSPSAEVRAQLRGESLAAALRGEARPRGIISETDYRQYTYKRSLIAPEGWKLIFTLESKTRELYDLNSDPHEQRECAAQFPTVADELEARLFEHYVRLGHDLKARTWQPGMNPVYDLQAG